MNWQSVKLFLDLDTQWRCVSRGMGGLLFWLGLDYSSAVALAGQRSLARRRRAPISRLMDDLRVMEDAALVILNEVSAE